MICNGETYVDDLTAKLLKQGYWYHKLRKSFSKFNSRRGYCRLKEYQHKVGIADSPTCESGAIEDVQHFLLECPNYHVPFHNSWMNVKLKSKVPIQNQSAFKVFR